MYLLTLDVGQDTGTTLFKFEDNTLSIVWSREIGEYEIDFVIEDIISSYRDEIEVVAEKFTITPQTGKLSSAPWSLEKIGVARYLCRKYKVKFSLQTPSDAKNFSTNKRLRDLGLWVKGGDGHALDSVRHGVIYAIRNFHWRPAGLLDVDDE